MLKQLRQLSDVIVVWMSNKERIRICVRRIVIPGILHWARTWRKRGYRWSQFPPLFSPVISIVFISVIFSISIIYLRITSLKTLYDSFSNIKKNMKIWLFFRVLICKQGTWCINLNFTLKYLRSTFWNVGWSYSDTSGNTPFILTIISESSIVILK